MLHKYLPYPVRKSMIENSKKKKKSSRKFNEIGKKKFVAGYGRQTELN